MYNTIIIIPCIVNEHELFKLYKKFKELDKTGRVFTFLLMRFIGRVDQQRVLELAGVAVHPVQNETDRRVPVEVRRGREDDEAHEIGLGKVAV